MPHANRFPDYFFGPIVEGGMTQEHIDNYGHPCTPNWPTQFGPCEPDFNPMIIGIIVISAVVIGKYFG